GDEVVTNGGVRGRIKDLDEQFITLEVAPGVDQRVQRQAISAVMPKGTLKNHLK
ncbi:MAG: preprotein translocase subunit YajC, partial [Gammaproteobacteria bacterium]|nr:preprotein translocase subunit YajC [Gammaproteobacteria bacterium]